MVLATHSCRVVTSSTVSPPRQKSCPKNWFQPFSSHTLSITSNSLLYLSFIKYSRNTTLCTAVSPVPKKLSPRHIPRFLESFETCTHNLVLKLFFVSWYIF
ncbi:Os09g0313550 [Oryza sativa Japonica Group]|uniref:Os09g0313550 protein n=1 Tax=Oryza sativa subsp. japonica TaxID=39947 RepID=A0A0P0XJV6_ORYSJ|nr:Os09g0313550 [Oryza sativa Japonica Group]